MPPPTSGIHSQIVFASLPLILSLVHHHYLEDLSTGSLRHIYFFTPFHHNSLPMEYAASNPNRLDHLKDFDLQTPTEHYGPIIFFFIFFFYRCGLYICNNCLL